MGALHLLGSGNALALRNRGARRSGGDCIVLISFLISLCLLAQA